MESEGEGEEATTQNVLHTFSLFILKCEPDCISLSFFLKDPVCPRHHESFKSRHRRYSLCCHQILQPIQVNSGGNNLSPGRPVVLGQVMQTLSDYTAISMMTSLLPRLSATVRAAVSRKSSVESFYV